MTPAVSLATELEARARQSLGSSSGAVHQMVARALAARGIRGGRLVDVGCGGGAFWRTVAGSFDDYCGIDAVQYDGFPGSAEFHRVDLDQPAWPVLTPGDVVVAIETIEHLENPWAFMRQLAALTKPGGWLVVTTPNQLSVLSLLSLIGRRRFVAFQDEHYPAHRTALLTSDLQRAAVACALEAVAVEYSLHGRLPLTPWHYPAFITRWLPEALSDNAMLIGRTPRQEPVLPGSRDEDSRDRSDRGRRGL